jgi:F-type H+-transporting ATPase subunit b
LRTTKHRIALILILLPCFLFLSSEEEHHGPNPLEFIGKVVNFTILFGGLIYLLYKPAKKFLEDRAQSIDSSMKEAEDSRSQAERTLEESRRRLAELSQEISRMDEDALLIGKREGDQIIAQAREDASRIQEQTQIEIDMISRARVKELKEYVVTLAAAQALARIQQTMTDRSHAQLIDKSIERLERLHDKESFG